MEKTFTIQQVAEMTNLSVHTLRYYERIGLLDPVTRTENGHRSYSVREISWVEFLIRLRVTGMSIRKMQEFASLRRMGDGTIRDRRALLEQHEKDIRENIAELERNLKGIVNKIILYKQMEGKNEPEN